MIQALSYSANKLLKMLSKPSVAVIAVVFGFSQMAFCSDGASGRTMFQQFVWPGGGVIGIALIAMNIFTYALIVELLIKVRRVKLCPDAVHQQIAELFKQRDFRQAIELTNSESSMLSGVVSAALAEASGGFGAMQRALGERVEAHANQLLRRIEPLNIIGNIAPMMGLMGTVLGMILAFNKIVEHGGTPDAAQLADAIGLALVTTFWALVVAVPAMAAWSVLRNRIDALASETTVVAEELIGVFRPQATQE